MEDPESPTTKKKRQRRPPRRTRTEIFGELTSNLASSTTGKGLLALGLLCILAWLTLSILRTLWALKSLNKEP
jgi:hypothetical protein